MKKLRILTARPHRLLTPVIEDIRRFRNKKILLLVPEHMTISMEETLMNSLETECLMGIDVISPTKLYSTLIHHMGGVKTEPLGKMGRNMAIGQALEKTEAKLRYYRRAAHYPGMIEKFSAILTDMKRGGMKPETLLKVAENTEDPIGKAKYGDLAEIYTQYQNLLENRFHDSDDRMGFLADSMEEAAYLKNKILFIYGFDTITEQLSALIEGAISVCRQVIVALVCDAHSKTDGSLYLPIQESIDRLIKKAGGINKVDYIHLHSECLTNPPDIAFLDSFPVHAAPLPYEGEVQSIECCSAVHPYEEATLMSRKVLKCLQEGIPLSRMVVLFPNDPNYQFAISAALSDAGIHFFDNRPMPVLSHPLVSFLLNALKAMETQWSHEVMLPLLESNYAPLSFDEACHLRDYAIAYGIQYKQWENPFSRGKTELVKDMETLRIQFMEPLLHCRNALVSAKDAKSSLEAVFTLLCEINAYEKLTAEQLRLEKLGLTQQADQIRQLWDVLIDLMDEALRLEADKRIPIKHIANRFENALSAVTLSALPPSGEVLQIGVLDHLLIQEADVVFLMGLNEGVICRDTESLLRPEERLQAEQLSGCYLGLTDVSRNLLAELDLRKAMTLPRKKLCLSYSENSADGSPKEILNLLQRILEKGFSGKIPIHHMDEELPCSAYQAEVCLLQAEPSEFRQEQEAIAQSLSSSQNGTRLSFLLDFDSDPLHLTQDEAARLYGERHLTISRLESFANCPFMHFVEYGLRPLENQEWRIDHRITGDFCHKAMDSFGEKAAKLPAYPQISQEELHLLTEDTLLPMIEELRGDLLRDGARNESVLNRCCDAVRSSIQNITDQLAQGSYRIWKTEADFGYGNDLAPIVLKLPGGKEVALRGRIDRIDLCRETDPTAIRVIDYKSSGKELVPGKITFGLQMQLLLYLSVCTQTAARPEPAGAFYFHIADPLVENAEDESERVETLRKKAFFMNGVRVDEFDSLNGSKVPYAKTIHVSLEQMELLLQKTGEVAAVLAEKLLQGDTSILPSSFGTATACEYCPSSQICKMDQRSPAAKFNEVKEMTSEELISILNEKLQS